MPAPSRCIGNSPVAFHEGRFESNSLLECATILARKPAVACHVVNFHFQALSSSHAHVRQASSDDLSVLCAVAPNIKTATLAIVFVAPSGRPLRAPAFAHLTDLTLVAGCSLTLSRPDQSFVFLFLANSPNLRKLRISYAQTGMTHYIHGHAASPLPFKLDTYVVEPLFDGFEQPLLSSRGTLHTLSVRFFQDLYERQRTLVSVLQLPQCGGSVRELSVERYVTWGAALEQLPQTVVQMVLACPRLERLAFDTRGTADAETLRAMFQGLGASRLRNLRIVLKPRMWYATEREFVGTLVRLLRSPSLVALRALVIVTPDYIMDDRAAFEPLAGFCDAGKIRFTLELLDD